MPGTLAIDVGGTFTDITFADAATGATWVAKTPSTPGDLSGGFITAIKKVLALAGRTPPDVLRVFHGTTTATNAILEGKTLCLRLQRPIMGDYVTLRADPVTVTRPRKGRPPPEGVHVDFAP